MWKPSGCGSPWAAFSSGAVEAHPTLPYPRIPKKGTRPIMSCGGLLVVEAPGCAGPLVVEAPGQLPGLPSPKSSPERGSLILLLLE